MPPIPIVPPIQAILPTKQYPHLRQLIHELDFKCSSCSSAYGMDAWRTFIEADKDPISGPGNGSTRFLMKCQECHTVPEVGPYIENGILDLLAVPKGYKRPPRASLDAPNSLKMEDEEELSEAEETLRLAEKARRPLGGKAKKKDSDLHPKSKAERNKAKASAAAGEGGDAPPLKPRNKKK